MDLLRPASLLSQIPGAFGRLVSYESTQYVFVDACGLNTGTNSSDLNTICLLQIDYHRVMLFLLIKVGQILPEHDIHRVLVVPVSVIHTQCRDVI